MSATHELPVRRNTFLLSAALATNSAMLQLSAAVASLTLVAVLDVEGLLGLGPAIVLASSALAALPAGRAMDRIGRVPVLAAGYLTGAAGCALAALGSASELAPAVLGGLVLVGAASGVALLSRTAAGDMYPTERRARGIALVLFGAVFGAILGPAVFSPLLAGRDLDGEALAPLWLAAGAFMLVGCALVSAVRPDPRRIAELLEHERAPEPGASRIARAPARPRPRAYRRAAARAARPSGRDPGADRGAGELRGDGRRDDAHRRGRGRSPRARGARRVPDHRRACDRDVRARDRDRRPDRPHRPHAVARRRLFVMAVSVISLLWVESVPATAVALFGLGLGWNLSFVAATAELADLTLPSERGRLLGFNDLLSGATGAGLALLGGLALSALGVAALAFGGTLLVVGPALWILRYGMPEPVAKAPPPV